MTPRSFLLSSAALVTLSMSVACGDEPPTQEEFEAQALTYQAATRDAGAGACVAKPSGKGPTCDACLNQSCCKFFAACENDVQCKAIHQCVAACQQAINPQAPDARAKYNTCGAACYSNYPQGVQTFAAASTCMDGCKASCP